MFCWWLWSPLPLTVVVTGPRLELDTARFTYPKVLYLPQWVQNNSQYSLLSSLFKCCTFNPRIVATSTSMSNFVSHCIKFFRQCHNDCLFLQWWEWTWTTPSEMQIVQEINQVIVSDNVSHIDLWSDLAMEARTSFQCWGGGGGTETVTEAEDSLLRPPVPGVSLRPVDMGHVHHMSLESLSQLVPGHDLYYSYQDCLRNAYSM